jgi:fatty acid desaturase
MDRNIDQTSRLTKDEMRALLRKADAPGLTLFAVQCVAFVLLFALTAGLAAAGSPLRWPAVVAAGANLLMFFASMHEAGHGTAFASPWLNRAALWISAPLMLQAPTYFREFHFEHHRRTSDPDGDPEIAGAPGLLAPWPGNLPLYLARASGQHLMVGKALFTLSCALLPFDSALARLHPFLRPAYRREVVVQSIAVCVLVGAFVAAGLVFVPGFAFALLAWPVAHLGLGLFVMPEHTGLPADGTQLHRTRSTVSNALVRRAMWNMSWHAEHHAFPAVPWHALPELGRRIAPDVEHRAQGYAAFHAEALRRSLART